MTSHTREDLQIISRRKALSLISEALVATKDIINTHERSLAIGNYLELQPATDKLALMSLLSVSRTAPALPPKSDHSPAGAEPARP